MARVFSGIQPSGEQHLGNYLGATRNWTKLQHETDAIFCIVDLHSLTLRPDPAQLNADSIELTNVLLASGLDPEVCTLFAQSHVPQHAELGWIMECTASYGELTRMVQFKEKSSRADFISAGLFTYPALQAADILLYDTDLVPVGDDQRQHVELTRDVAERFNNRYGETLVVPEHAIPPVGARVMDLQNPHQKMSKSVGEDPGTIWVLDEPAKIMKKFKRAVTDSESDVYFDVEKKPGVSNLLSILAASTGGDPVKLGEQYTQYGALKVDTGEAVVAMLEPIQARYTELREDPSETKRLLGIGAEKAKKIAVPVIERVRSALGLLDR